jgi:ABC-type transporter Mla subunit MlaD
MKFPKFSANERKAMAGMLLILGFVAASVYQIGMRNFWFERKNVYFTYVRDADGLRVGSPVTIAGLRVGEVADLDVGDKNQIRVRLSVRAAVSELLRQDAAAMVFRSFIIGDKRIELITGTPELPELANRATLPPKETLDLAEFASGKKLAEMLGQAEVLLSGLSVTMKEVTEVIGKYKGGEFASTLTMVEPALGNFMKLSSDLLVLTKEMKKQPKAIPTFVDSGTKLLDDAHADLFANDALKKTLANVDGVMMPLAQRQKLIADLLTNLEVFSAELTKNPEFTKQVLEAVQEMTITLKALQKTWILKSETEDVKSGN